MVTLGTIFEHLPLREQGPGVLGDVESHLPPGHPYKDADRITTVHESTHGICSQIRKKYDTPGFYLLKNRAILLPEPNLLLEQITIPLVLRGDGYDLYLVKARRWWNKQPSYVWEEYVAYTNGSEAREELGIGIRWETVQYAIEFLIYSSYIPYLTGDTSCREFLRWQNERALGLYHRSAVSSPQLLALRSDPTLQSYRYFLRDYYGEMWCTIWLRI